MIKYGHDFKTMFICGGLTHNHLFVQIHADITGTSFNTGRSLLIVKFYVLNA